MYTTLVSAAELADLPDDHCLVDCRFSLMDTTLGAQQYAEGHARGAVYAHLDDDLSGEIVLGKSGRHPLPSREAFVRTLRAWGINSRTQVVAYDDSGGPFAARLWWMLRWIGHESAAVLDGGYAAYLAAGGPVSSEPASPRSGRVTEVRDTLAEVVTAQDVMNNSGWTLLDAREGARYRGDAEPLDPVAGHIPGALNLPCQQNLTADGRFKPAGDLRDLYNSVLGNKDVGSVVCYCGSGVTAAHNALAMTHAGLGTPKLYAGSWSEWITDVDRPVSRESQLEE